MEKLDIQYKINGIDLVEKHLFRFEALPETTEFNFQISSQTVFSKDPIPLFVVFTSIELNRIGSPDLLAKFLVAIGFQILNPDVVFKEGNGSNINWPLEVENFFKALAISTTRGILYSELRGTPLHSAILPVIDMGTFKKIEGDLINEK